LKIVIVLIKTATLSTIINTIAMYSIKEELPATQS